MSKRINKTICMIAQASYPDDPRIRRQAEALEKTGYEVDVICRPLGNQSKVEKFGRITAYRVVNAPRQDSMIKWIYYSSIFFICAFWKIQGLYTKRKYDVIQVHNMPDHLLFSAIVQKLLGVPLILDIHDLTIEMFLEKWPGKKSSLIIGFAKFIEKKSTGFADQIITVTKTCKERLVSRGVPDNKITLVFNTPNEDVFQFNCKREFKVIERELNLIYYGTIAKRFGLHTAIQAMEYVIKEIPDSKLNIYGFNELGLETDYEILLKNLVVKYKLENFVRLNGFVPRDEIPRIINYSDVGLVPYENSEYMNLALPTKAFEYIATGLPVISTYLEDLSKSFNERSISYVKSNDPKELAEKIIFMSRNPDICKNMVHSAYNELRKISGTVMNERYLNLISSMISTKVYSKITERAA